MCEYLDRLEAKGIAKGRAEGMREGIGEGERNTLINLVKKGLLTIDEAMEESSDPEGLAKALKA